MQLYNGFKEELEEVGVADYYGTICHYVGAIGGAEIYCLNCGMICSVALISVRDHQLNLLLKIDGSGIVGSFRSKDVFRVLLMSNFEVIYIDIRPEEDADPAISWGKFEVWPFKHLYVNDCNRIDNYVLLCDQLGP